MRKTIPHILFLVFAVGLVAGPAGAYVLSGRVYEGQTGVEAPPLGDAKPLAGVTVNLYGALSADLTGIYITHTTTDVDGWYGLSFSAEVHAYDFYNIVAMIPAGYTSIGATSVRGTVRAKDWIQYGFHNLAGTTTGNKFWFLSETVPSENQPPEVFAGNDQVMAFPIPLPYPVPLAGAVSDDGRPVGEPLVIEWSLVSGPGEVVFEDAANPETTALFYAYGSYVLRLTAFDGELEGFDEVTIEIRESELEPVRPDEPIDGPAPLAWWSFDEISQSVAPDNMGDNHGTIHGATWTLGRVGGALSFDGIDDVLTTPVNVEQAGHSEGVTLCAWVYPESIEWGRHQVISSDDGGYDWSLLHEGGMWHVFTGENSAGTGLAVDAGRWQFVAAVFESGAGIRFHKNRQEVFIPSIDYDTSDNNVAIGGNPGGWPEFFGGMIDEVRVYGDALSPEDIQKLLAPGGMLSIPEPELYVGSYTKVSVDIDPSTGLTPDDLEFVIPAGPKGGQVSLSRDESFNPMAPDIMLLAGYEPGTYHLQAVEKLSKKVLADTQFSVHAMWLNDAEGPSRWVCGDFELPGIPGAAWGGGSPTEPENYNIKPAIGTNNVAILLVDTSSQRYNQSDVPAIRTLWEDLAFNGRVTNNKTVSTAHYYREVSHYSASPPRGFNITGQVFGPVQLPGAWSNYLEDNGKYKGNIWQACATAGDQLINYSNFDHLVCVVQSVTTPQRRVWPHADAMVAKVGEGDIPLGTVVMPADGAAFGLSATLAHELGHNLDLGDIYDWGGHPAHIRERELWGMALMARQGDLPQPVLVHRMRLGWVPKKDLKLYNFQAMGGAVVVDETITLHPAELANPPAGRYSGIEVRIAPGWNYYFEYRVAQPQQIGDQNLWCYQTFQAANDRVLGTDVMFGDNIEDLNRRKPVMLLRTDNDGDGPVLGQGQDYEEQDRSDPEFYTDFKATVTDIDGTKADVLIEYGVYSEPDPSIRPWNPPVYKSPDIKVRNARSQNDPKWKDVPWLNHHNTLVAKITNGGEMNAPQVHVDFYVKDLTVDTSDSNKVKRVWIGDDYQDVPPKQTVEFTTTWMPKAAGHYCIEAIIEYYHTPVAEANPYNNRAQSNYDRFISAKASAPSREVASIKVHNPFNKPTRAFIRFAKSTSPLFRTYLEHTWLWLQPGETRDVKVMFEYAYEEDPVWSPALEQYISKPCDVSICGLIEQPDADPEQAAVLLGGVTAQVVTGWATRFAAFDIEFIATVFPPIEHAFGQIVTVDDGSSVPGGKVILIVVAADGEEEYRSAEVSQDGFFTVDASGDWNSVQAYYVPSDGYGDCTSELLVSSN